MEDDPIEAKAFSSSPDAWASTLAVRHGTPLLFTRMVSALLGAFASTKASCCDTTILSSLPVFSWMMCR